MASYCTLGTNDPAKAVAFYDAVLGTAGIERFFEHPSGGAVYGKDGKVTFGIIGPFNKEPATVGNGTMIGFEGASREVVDAMHAKALELGGTCEGAPGLRGPDGGDFYFAYFRDLEGNKLCAFKIG